MSFVDLKKFLKNCQHLEKLELQYADGLEDQIEEVQPTESLSDVVYSFLSGVKSYFREEVITTSHEHIEEISVRALPQTLQELDLSYSDVGP
jgi:hypothetical protein|tara:strand:- start:25 stop:300 length:276 start_codon:yes stop_codon:yes gene_type:complete